MTVQNRPQCWRCKDQGFVRAPCTVCGAFRTSSGDIAYQAGSLWGDQAPPVFRKPRKKPRADRP